MAQGNRLTIVQYAGDFKETSLRLASGGTETYRAQRYSVEYVESLAKRLSSVTTITACTQSRYDSILSSGTRAIGAGYRDKVNYSDLIALIESSSPDLLIVRAPFGPVFHWAKKRGCRTLALLADSFPPNRLIPRLKLGLLAYYLNSRNVDIIANHGINASRQLVTGGVNPGKVVPWDWPSFDTPTQYPAKTLKGTSAEILYVGLLSETKGVFDLISAINILVRQGFDVTAKIIGRDEGDKVKSWIAELGLTQNVQAVGILANQDIIPAMRSADIVVVPSWHQYPEGMPLTIYEALCSRTPIVASDHPMFLENIRHDESALIFSARNVNSMVTQIMRLINDPDLYVRLSNNSEIAWQRLQLPVQWAKLIDMWIANDQTSREWLSKYSMLKYNYTNSI